VPLCVPGKKPKKIPTAPEKTNANATASQDTNDGHAARELMSFDPLTPRPMPTSPP